MKYSIYRSIAPENSLKSMLRYLLKQALTICKDSHLVMEIHWVKNQGKKANVVLYAC